MLKACKVSHAQPRATMCAFTPVANMHAMPSAGALNAELNKTHSTQAMPMALASATLSHNTIRATPLAARTSGWGPAAPEEGTAAAAPDAPPHPPRPPTTLPLPLTRFRPRPLPTLPPRPAPRAPPRTLGPAPDFRPPVPLPGCAWLPGAAAWWRAAGLAEGSGALGGLLAALRRCGPCVPPGTCRPAAGVCVAGRTCGTTTSVLTKFKRS